VEALEAAVATRSLGFELWTQEPNDVTQLLLLPL